MARPRGYRLNRAALLDLLEAKRLTMTDAAERCGIPLKSLSSLATPAVQHRSRASISTVGKVAAGLNCAAETLFPELANFADASEREPEAVAS